MLLSLQLHRRRLTRLLRPLITTLLPFPGDDVLQMMLSL